MNKQNAKQDKKKREELPDVEDLVPSEKGELAKQSKSDISDLVTDEVLMGMYAEIMEDLRQNTKETDQYLSAFADMVINDGDSSNASKEALVNLVKIKTDIADKKSKVAELMTRIKMKEKDASRFITKEGQVINIGGDGSKRSLLDQIDKAKKRIK